MLVVHEKSRNEQSVARHGAGEDLERRLLLKQLSVLEAERHVAKVMVALETAGRRRAFWTRTETRVGQLRAKVEQLLERDFYCE